MDNLQPPEELQHLWLDSSQKTANAETIVTWVLRDARKRQRRMRATDVGLVALGAVQFPILLLIAWDSWDEAPLAAAGYLVWVVTVATILLMYRFYFRSLGQEPPPNATSREYTEHSIEYLNRRERFLVRTATPCSTLESLAGILFAFAAANDQQRDLSLLWVVVCFLLQPLNWWWILYIQRRYSRERSRLRTILADLDRDAQR